MRTYVSKQNKLGFNPLAILHFKAYKSAYAFFQSENVTSEFQAEI